MNSHIPKVNIGDTIGLITPSSPLFPGRLEAGIAYFEKKGFKVKVGKNNNKADRFLAGSDEERAEDIMNFFADPNVKAIIVTGGGAGSIRVLPYLDYNIIKKNPKLLVGFSDTTALQLGIYSQTNLISVTGFTCRDVEDATNIDNLVENSLLSCLTQRNFSHTAGKTVRSGKVTASILGGNLSCLISLLGTRFEPDFTGKILLFEEVWQEPYIIDSMMAQLSLAGIFDKVAGIIIGQFLQCEPKHFPERDGTVDDVINDWSKKIKVPCIKNFTYAHMPSRCVLPIGQAVTLDAEQCSVDTNFAI
ncbi:MAG: LD-carboxypeptidase [Rickettsiaceae bacterium]|nr:LD-carboxypeptidase [Rickettsiaceae bacterium]